jgi:UDP-2,3-diacylglucosamine pyrophosphatase LpxH
MPRVRSIFLSDVHLGTPACQAGALLEFLKAYESEHLFLVGDIVDFWAIQRRGVYWSTEQNTVVQKILKRARQEVSVVFVPGNHDEAAREHAGASFGNIRVERDYLHVAADGRRYLLIHGDEFDQVTKLKLPGYWSLAGYAKHRVKRAVSFIFDFEDSVLRHARERGVDGVICGHIHSAVIRDQGGIAYLNCGDWVDSCTAIVEHPCGAMELVHWSGMPCAADSSSSVPTGGTPHDDHEKSARCDRGAGNSRHSSLGTASAAPASVDCTRAGHIALAGRYAGTAGDLSQFKAGRCAHSSTDLRTRRPE